MVNILLNNWKLIITTVFYIHCYGDAAEPLQESLLWKVFRRFLDEGGLTGVDLSTKRVLNNSNVIEDATTRRVKLKKHPTTESYSSHQTVSKNHTRQRANEIEKIKYPTRFLVEKDSGAAKHHFHKDRGHIEKERKTSNITEYQNPRGKVNETVELNKKNIQSKSQWRKPKEQVLENHGPETLLAVMQNQTKVKTNQNDYSKLAVRAVRNREDSNESGESKKNTKKQLTTIRITKMLPAYQLQEDPEDEQPSKHQPNGKKVNDRLNPYAIDQQMQRFMDFYQDDMNITMEIIGRTAEYNNIILLKITDIKRKNDKYFRVRFQHKYADEPPEKKIIFIVHGLAVMGMGNLIENEAMFRTLMSFYAAHLPYFDIFVIPIANPDGFSAILNFMMHTSIRIQYTKVHWGNLDNVEIPKKKIFLLNRMAMDNTDSGVMLISLPASQHGKFWNKNVSPQSSCSGVALDRNFDVEWNTSQRISPCSHLYPGPAPFSEPETRAVRDILHLYSQKIVAYIHVHASTFDSSIFKGDAVLFPRGYTNVQIDDDKYMDIKSEVEESLKNATFRVISVTIDTLYNWYGQVFGTSVDYASTVYGIPYAMEFAMQSYAYLEKDALFQIWRRIIDVVFRNIWKSVSSNYDNN